ncbi:kinase-like protein [Hypoxylon trugodes]|uniref:kinase-like protein n=1 Tax=Hypoxylon trugodes TaxID=326681 RepID=UPI0021933D41|nr:kinase-like protein [Hypoxylon trugodes]KAI1394282.1 kinase-like protein [Hypoxylon trugodes]
MLGCVLSSPVSANYRESLYNLEEQQNFSLPELSLMRASSLIITSASGQFSTHAPTLTFTMSAQFETAPTNLDLSGQYPIAPRSQLAPNHHLAAIRGNAPPEITITSVETVEATRKERYSERSSVVQDLGRELRWEHSTLSQPDTSTQGHDSDSADLLLGISGGSNNNPVEVHGEIRTLLDSHSRIAPKGNGEDNEVFIPLDAQEEIISHAKVKRELRNFYSGQELDCLVEYICGNKRSDATKIGRQIFAILVLMGKQNLIKNFHAAHIYDANLPFRSCGIGNNLKLIPKGLGNDQDIGSLRCFESWTSDDKVLFSTYQWRMLSPFFDRRPDRPPFYYPLENKIVLPWTECRQMDDTGGHSHVWRVKIHDAHHGFGGGKGKGFALKVLHSPSRDDFDAEFGALEKLNPHDHLVPVLAAFNHHGKYYLIFPWAEGSNLSKFWEAHPKPILPETALWFAKQCYGLATALHHIHDISTTVPKRDRLRGDGMGPRDRDRMKTFGRHGDIKPENVLQFEEGDSELGVLKISDFGLTIFHSARSRSNDRLRPGQIPLTYNAPEGNGNANITRRYDIWGLGCVYLDFVTWLFLGYQGVDNFNQARCDERSIENFYTDQFFKSRKWLWDVQHVVKQSVTSHISQLQSRHDCSTFLCEFLDIIKNDMLVVNEKSRIECGELEIKLRNMFEKCRRDRTYLLQPRPKSTRPFKIYDLLTRNETP